MPDVNVNGTTLYYYEQGNGTTLLFIHGMCGDADVWREQTARLSKQFRCIAYDRRGHSRSSLGDVTQRTVQLHADDAAGLIKELGVAPVILVGSSGGARVALDVVRRYPELIAGAVLSEPPLFALDQTGARALMSELKPAIEAAVAVKGPQGAVDSFFDYMCPGLWRNLTETQREKYRKNHVELFGDLQMPSYEVSTADLAQIDRPCLVMSGSESLPLMRNVAQILHRGISGADFVELEGSGHVTYYERPTEFEAAVVSFVKSISAKSR